MTTKDLIRFIIDNGYPFDIVDFEQEYPNEAFCIRQTKFNNWEVYYSERGQKSGLVTFDKEAEACKYLREKIKTSYNTV